MIDDDLKSSSDGSTLDDNSSDEISKSQRKRDADAIRDLGAQLTQLAASELATIPLPDDVQSAIDEFSRIRANGARKRQLGFIAKRLRNVDIDPIETALEKIRLTARANTTNLHRIEQWRDRLIGLNENESAKDALTAFLTSYSSADRQNIRHLQKQAITERQAGKNPAAARQLFKALREILQTPTDPS